MKISIVLILCIGAMWCEDIKFNRDLVSVYFAPFIFPDDINFPYDHHDKNDLIKMLKAISTKFNKVAMTTLEADGFNPEWSEALIPSAVAEFNNNFLNRNEKLELTMQYKPQLEENIHTNYDLVKKYADEANSMHNGTISTIVMHYWEDLTDEIMKNLTDSLDYAKKANQQNSNLFYKLGASLPINGCHDIFNQLEKLLGKLDVVVFQISTISSLFTTKAYFAEVVNKIQKCQRKIQEKKRNLKIQFLVYRSDTPKLRSQDVSLLVNFWDQMNEWATQTNTSIVFHEAFDSFANTHNRFRFCGWWRAKNGLNGSLLDFVIEEKATGITSMKRPKFESFSRKHFLVMFDPFVNPDKLNNFYVQSGLQNMLKTISSRFNQVVLRSVPLSSAYEKGESDTLIPSAMAYFNANKTNQENPMEAVMTCSLEIPTDLNMKTSFDIAKGLADEANMIYNGTVKTILIDYLKLNMTTLETVKAQLKYSKETIANETAFPYNVGMILHILDCGQSSRHLEEFLIPVLPLINVVYFNKNPSSEEIGEGFDSSFPLIFKRFERCLLKIRKIHKHLSIGFRSEWSDTNERGVQNMNALVKYWQRANDWAVALNTTVVMWEAFDNFYREKEIDKSLGWWKLDISKEFQDQSEYVFLEKLELLKVIAEGNSSSTVAPTSQGLDTMSVVIFGVSGLVLVFAFIGGLVFFAYKKLSKKLVKAGMTKKEMRQFFQGGALSGEGNSACFNICSEPYNKSLELSKEAFFIDETELLGSGTFGSVYLAIINPSTEQERKVAVKRTTSENPSSAVKNLLAEIKILSHVGIHENIIGIVGAYTTEINRGHVLVFYELGQNGSLESYLRNYSQRHELNTTEYTDICATTYVNSIELSTLENPGMASQLEKWSFEIANGMEFLVTKHVVHADLATRNVLLTENKTAKISDFGLSRRMYDYQNYFKSQQEPLPWRWMAPESLRRMKFGEKSDVWAFGITLWEMYSFGDVPYPGLPWSIGFIKMLEDGLRPDQPRHATPDIYNNVMMKCWEMLPSSRPTFAELKEMLK